jgi:signal transduction histidine kinase
MITDFLQILTGGLSVIKLNTRLVLVIALLFIFPLLFVWVALSFYNTAYNNIHTAEKGRIGILHDTVSTLLREDTNYEKTIESLIGMYMSENSDISKIRLVKKEKDGFFIVLASDKSLIGTYEKSDQLYKTLPFSDTNDSFFHPSNIDGVRTWQVLRSVEIEDGVFYLFTEHKFGMIDSVMTARMQQSYFGLTAIFVFLITLAYWLNKQVNWEKNHNLLSLQLKERDLFSNMIAHEFRSPLTAINGYASFLLESKNLSKDEIRYTANISNSAKRLVVLVNDFLEVARLQAGKMKIEEKEIDICEVLTKAVEDLDVMAKEKGLKLIYKPNKKPIPITTDSARLTQVFTNIISNSIKYTDKGTVTVECEQEPGEIIILIKDTGMGISAEDQQKLFTPFSRVGDVDRSVITGTGLGMWITKQLVTILHGTIGVESIKGVGTHIVIKFKTKKLLLD